MTNPTDKLPGLRCLLKWPLQIKMAELSLWAWLPFFVCIKLSQLCLSNYKFISEKGLRGRIIIIFNPEGATTSKSTV